MGSVNITLANGQLGATLQTNDGITGMVLTGSAEAGGYALGTPKLITSLADLTLAGITETGNPFAYKQVQEFYRQAGTGAQLYLMLVSTSMSVAEMADNTNVNGAVKLLNFANGKIKVLGLLSDDEAIEDATEEPPTITNGLNEEVYQAAANMAVTAAAYFQAQKPFRAIIGGSSFSGAPAVLTDVTAGTTNNRTAILIGDTVSGSGACLGLLLGVISSVPVQRKVSRVRSGALATTQVFVGTTNVEGAEGSLGLIAERGFITFTTYPNVSGFFFSGDPMCTATTDDYGMISRGRVIDKAHILAYTTFVQEVDDEIPVNPDGTLDTGFCKWLQQQIVNQINATMTANKEISNVNCFIDPVQNILSTNQLNVVLTITPVGYATNISINLGFTNPAL
jgi:hypothetical protein